MIGRQEVQNAWTSQGGLFAPNSAGVRTDAAVILQTGFEPGYYTLQFWVSRPPGQNFALNTRAEIHWSVQGGSVRRVIDVFNGATISGAGQGINCKITDASSNSNSATPVPYGVSVNLVRGLRPNMAGSQPPIFTPRDAVFTAAGTLPPPYTLASGESCNIPIPDNSGVNAVMLMIAPELTGAAIAPLTDDSVIVFQRNTLPVRVFNTYCYSALQKFVPIAPGATELNVHNNTYAVPRNIRVTPIFGVEG